MPSGAGKTSLLRLLYLAVRPTRGRLTLLGTDVTTAPRRALPPLRRRIGVVFQDFRLLPHLSAFDNVALPLRIAGRPEGQIRADVGELLRWVGLSRHLDARPAELSGGEQQRVAIARAVITRPALLLADEPTGNLDDGQAERLMQLFKEMNRIGTTVIVATHNETLVARHPGAGAAHRQRPAGGQRRGRRMAAGMRAVISLRPSGFDELGSAAGAVRPDAAAAGRGDGVPGGAGAGRLVRHRGAVAALAAGRRRVADGAGAAGRRAGGSTATQTRLAAVLALLTGTPGVASAHALSDQELADLLRPWLGQGAERLAIPIPAVIAVRLTDSAIDLDPLSRRLTTRRPARWSRTTASGSGG